MIQLSQYFYFHCSEIPQDVNEFHFYFMLNFYALWLASLLNFFDTPNHTPQCLRPSVVFALTLKLKPY